MVILSIMTNKIGLITTTKWKCGNPVHTKTFACINIDSGLGPESEWRTPRMGINCLGIYLLLSISIGWFACYVILYCGTYADVKPNSFDWFPLPCPPWQYVAGEYKWLITLLKCYRIIWMFHFLPFTQVLASVCVHKMFFDLTFWNEKLKSVSMELETHSFYCFWIFPLQSSIFCILSRQLYSVCFYLAALMNAVVLHLTVWGNVSLIKYN